MLKEYFKAKDGCETILTEGGFLSYLIVGKQFYISDFWLAESHRQSPKHLFSILGEARELAVKAECDFFACHVPLNILDLNSVLKIRMQIGFRLNGQLDGNRLILVLPVSECEWERP